MGWGGEREGVLRAWGLHEREEGEGEWCLSHLGQLVV